MKIKDLKISNRLKKCKIYCVPSTIRKCNGFVIEVLTKQPERKTTFDLLHELRDKHGYNIYSLRHKDNDMSEPHYVTEKGIFVNRFGWFVTKDKMEFTEPEDEVKLTTKNSEYYNLNSENNGIEKVFKHYGSCYELDVVEYISNEDKIWK